MSRSLGKAGTWMTFLRDESLLGKGAAAKALGVTIDLLGDLDERGLTGHVEVDWKGTKRWAYTEEAIQALKDRLADGSVRIGRGGISVQGSSRPQQAGTRKQERTDRRTAILRGEVLS